MLRMEVLRPTFELATLARCEVSTLLAPLRLFVFRAVFRGDSSSCGTVVESSLRCRLGE